MAVEDARTAAADAEAARKAAEARALEAERERSELRAKLEGSEEALARIKVGGAGCVFVFWRAQWKEINTCGRARVWVWVCVRICRGNFGASQGEHYGSPSMKASSPNGTRMKHHLGRHARSPSLSQAELKELQDKFDFRQNEYDQLYVYCEGTAAGAAGRECGYGVRRVLYGTVA